MKTDDIRTQFLKFFKSKGHTIVESDSVVPKDDPTVLFTTAGMQQFKRQFLGHIDDYTRAATSQKCIRTDDLDEVGKTDFHHTFFEMLGNFSFGDYFKKEAIAWGWEFLTEVLKIDRDRLWVSVYKEDTEAKEIWMNDIGIPEGKIFELGDKSNFWPANAKLEGPNGPCGPCSEIFYDYNPDAGTTPKDPDDEPDRFCEVWNLVFTQFNRKDGGELDPLPSKNIDTGMGLERLAAVLQGVKSNFDTDIFAPILGAIDEIIQVKQSNSERNERYVIADHMRGIVFGITDGVPPSNEGRGYVIKKLIIDISDIAIQSGHTEPIIYKLVPSVIEAMSAYPELQSKAQNIADTIKSVEQGYIKVRKERLPEFKSKLKDNQPAEKLGNLLWEYRDTYGLTINTLERALNETRNLNTDMVTNAWQIFELKHKEQQERSRASSKMQGDVFAGEDIPTDIPKTHFIGYDKTKCDTDILGIFIDGKATDTAQEDDAVKIILKETPFYAESGGQIGDSGTLKHFSVEAQITDTQKMDDIYLHKGVIIKGALSVGDTVTAEIDTDRRESIKKNHTATHLTQAVLAEVLGDHIKQQGSLVAEDRLRFDFTHPKTIASDELKTIEEKVNAYVQQNDKIKTETLPIDEAKKRGARAFFAEKYGDVVRVVSAGDYSIEFCGGTHVKATGDIGAVKIVNQSAVAQGIRRIEAVTGAYVDEYNASQTKELQEDVDRLNQKMTTINAKIVQMGGTVVPFESSEANDANGLKKLMEAQTKYIKQLEKQAGELQFNNLKNAIDDIIEKSEDVNGTKIICQSFENLDMGLLRRASDLIKQKAKSAIITLGASTNANASVLVSVTDDLVQKGIKANDLIQDIAPLIDGTGGGRPQMAQAGSKAVEKITSAIEQANTILKDSINK